MFRHDFLGESKLTQRFSGHHFRGELGQRNADRFAYKRDGARGARVNFKDVNIVAFYRELHVHEAAHIQFARHGFCRRRNFIENFFRQRECRNHTRAITAVDARFFDVFHDCADHGRFAIGNAIDVDLDCVLEETVNEHGTIGRHFDCTCHVTPKVFLVIDQLHGTSAKDERGPHQNRITNFLCDRDRFVGVYCRAARSLPQAKFVEHGRE